MDRIVNSTHQVVVDRFLPGLVVRFLDFRLLQSMGYVQCTDIKATVLVITVAMIERRVCVPDIVVTAVVAVVAR